MPSKKKKYNSRFPPVSKKLDFDTYDNLNDAIVYCHDNFAKMKKLHNFSWLKVKDTSFDADSSFLSPKLFLQISFV